MNIANPKTNLDPCPRTLEGGSNTKSTSCCDSLGNSMYLHVSPCQTHEKRSNLKNPGPQHCSWGDVVFPSITEATYVAMAENRASHTRAHLSTLSLNWKAHLCNESGPFGLNAWSDWRACHVHRVHIHCSDMFWHALCLLSNHGWLYQLRVPKCV